MKTFLLNYKEEIQNTIDSPKRWEKEGEALADLLLLQRYLLKNINYKEIYTISYNKAHLRD